MSKNVTIMAAKVTWQASTEDPEESASENSAKPWNKEDIAAAEVGKTSTNPTDLPAEAEGTTTTKVSQMVEVTPGTATAQDAHRNHPADAEALHSIARPPTAIAAYIQITSKHREHHKKINSTLIQLKINSFFHYTDITLHATHNTSPMQVKMNSVAQANIIPLSRFKKIFPEKIDDVGQPVKQAWIPTACTWISHDGTSQQFIIQVILDVKHMIKNTSHMSQFYAFKDSIIPPNIPFIYSKWLPW